MAKADLTAQRLRELLSYDPDTGIFYWRVNRRGRAKAGSKAGTPHSDGYWEIGVDGKAYRAHRLAWLYVHGYTPKEMLDHINRNRLDNRIENLRKSENYLNMRNAGPYKQNSSGVRGVSWSDKSKRWVAAIMDRGRNFHLGSYKSIEEAAAARYAAECVLFTKNEKSPATN